MPNEPCQCGARSLHVSADGGSLALHAECVKCGRRGPAVDVPAEVDQDPAIWTGLRIQAALDAWNKQTETMPCPFCGSRNVFVHEGSTFRWKFAECSECGARSGEVRVKTMGDGDPAEWTAEGIKAALDAWNTRATTAQLSTRRHDET